MNRVKAYAIIKIFYPNMDIENRKILADNLSNVNKDVLNKILSLAKAENLNSHSNKHIIPQATKKNTLSHNQILKENKKCEESPSIDITFLKTYQKYIFFGHGWGLSTHFNINKDSNICVVMLDSLTTCYDEINTDFLNELYGVSSPIEYIYKVNEIAKKTNNTFEMYCSKENSIVPDMLLTTFTKYNEFSALIDIDNKEKKYIPSIILLSELVKQLGNNFFIQVYSCRNQLDTFQYDNMDIFSNSFAIRKYINTNGIDINTDCTDIYKGKPFILVS